MILEPLEGIRLTNSPLSAILTMNFLGADGMGCLATGTAILQPLTIGQIGLDATTLAALNNTGNSYQVNIAGTLTVGSSGDYSFAVPATDGAILALSGGSLSGTQLVINEPSIGGDANLDGWVDNSDFSIWRNYIGHDLSDIPGNHWTMADFNGDQSVDNSDFATWRNNVGNWASARVINNTDLQGAAPATIHLDANTAYDFSFSWFVYAGNDDPSAAIQPGLQLSWAGAVGGQYYNINTSAPPTVSPISIAATAGSAYTQPLATFTTSVPNSVAADYAASVNWGDGSAPDTTANTDPAHRVTVSGNATAGFTVSGNHAFAPSSNPANATVTVTHTASGFHGSASIPVAVGPLLTAAPVAATTGEEFGGVIATINPSDPAAQQRDFSVGAISWSDGSTSDSPEVFANGDGSFSVWDTHTFATAGSYSASLTVSDTVRNNSASASLSAAVTDPIPEPAPTAPAQPTGLTVSAISSTSIGLVWDHIPDATSYTISRTGGADGTTIFPITDPSANSYVDSSLDSHTHYNYTVMATNDVGDSPVSDSAGTDTLNTPPLVADITGQFVVQNGTLDLPVAGFGGSDPDATAQGADTLTLDESSLSQPAHGNLTVVDLPTDYGNERVVRYTPTQGYHGPDSYTFTLSDGIDHSRAGTVDINVTQALPEATSFSVVTDHDGFHQGGSYDTFFLGAAPLPAGSTFVLVDPPAGVSLVDSQTGELSLPIDENGYLAPLEVQFKINDGTADGNTANGRFFMPGDAVATYDIPIPFIALSTPAHLAVTQGDSVNVAALIQTAGQSVSIIASAQHGAFTQQDDGSYVYTPNAEFAGGQDFVTYQLLAADNSSGPSDSLFHTIYFDVAPATPTITAHRAGLNWGQPVSLDAKRSGDSSNYVILTNDQHTENHTDGSADNTDTTATVPGTGWYPTVANPTPTESDLAQLDLGGVSATSGTLTLAFSDPTAVRVLVRDTANNPFDGTAHEVFASGQNETANLTADLSNLSSSPLFADGGTIFVEGLLPQADEVISLIYKNAAGVEVKRDQVHQRIVSMNDAATSNLLREGAESSTQIGDDGIAESAKFQIRVTGLDPSDVKVAVAALDGSAFARPVQLLSDGGADGSPHFDFYENPNGIEPVSAETVPDVLSFDANSNVDGMLVATLTTHSDRLLGYVAGCNRPFYQGAFVFDAFDPSATGSSSASAGGPASGSSASAAAPVAGSVDTITEEPPDPASVFPGNTADDGAGRLMLTYFQSLFGGPGEILLNTFLTAHNDNGGATCDNFIKLATFRWYNRGHSRTERTSRDGDAPQFAISIDNSMVPSDAATELYGQLMGMMTQAQFSTTLKSDFLYPALGEDPSVVATYRQYMEAAIAQVASTTKQLASFYYKGIGLIGTGANLVVAINDLAQGDPWALVNILPVVGKAFASTTVGAQATFKLQMLASDAVDASKSVIGAFSNTACKLLGQGCFLPGTLVQTESGPKPIEQIKAGDRIWSYEQATGRWILDSVDQPVSFAYDGDIVTLHTGADAISSTPLHPVWVVSGENLASRPEPDEVPEPDQTDGPAGRWVAAGDVRVGDVLLTEGGAHTQVLSIDHAAQQTTVYNLVVDQGHTFAVGSSGILVHNTACDFNAIKQLYKDGLLVIEEEGANGAKVLKVNGNTVINCSKAFEGAGEVTVQLRNAAGELEAITVKFKKTGFPEFTPFWYGEGGFKGYVKLEDYTGTRKGDLDMANELAHFADGTPKGYTSFRKPRYNGTGAYGCASRCKAHRRRGNL